MPNILVVDDLEIDRLLVQSVLERNPSYSVIQAINGVDALKQIGIWNIDLIVTDLHMPEMDGLELTDVVRKKYPHIPVILMTAMGNEDIATKALAAGASGYVPKRNVEALLPGTVSNALEILFTQHSYSDLTKRSVRSAFEFSLNNDPNLIPPLVDLFEKMLGAIAGVERIERLRLAIALEQAISNGMFRGNLEIPSNHIIPCGSQQPDPITSKMIEDRATDPQYNSRQVYVGIEMTRKKIEILVRDGGNGFVPDMIDNFVSGTGRGLTLISSFMDDVVFNDTGNQIKMVRYRRVEEPLDSHLHLGGPSFKSKFQSGQFDSEPKPILGELVSQKKHVRLDRPYFIIGRRESSHGVLKHPDVSNHHCKLKFQDGFWSVRDLNNRAGIRINGKPVQYGTLMPGDQLGIGPYDFEIKYELGQVIRNKSSVD